MPSPLLAPNTYTHVFDALAFERLPEEHLRLDVREDGADAITFVMTSVIGYGPDPEYRAVSSRVDGRALYLAQHRGTGALVDLLAHVFDEMYRSLRGRAQAPEPAPEETPVFAPSPPPRTFWQRLLEAA